MITITITSAVELTSKQLETIKKAVEKKHGSAVNYVIQVDDSLIGGLKVQIGSLEFDHSIKQKFNQIRSSLRNTI